MSQQITKMFLKLNFASNPFAKEIFYSVVALVTYLLVGINRSYLAFFFHQLDAEGSSITLTTEQKSWIASCICLFSPVGCLFSGFFMDIFGRKLFIQLIFVPFIVSWVCITLARNVTMLYVGVAVQGLSGGMSFCVASYVAEISTVAHRGALLSTLEVTYGLGILLCNELMYYLQWNVVALIFVFISSGGLAMTIFLPESPAWLYLKNKKEESLHTLCSLRCKDQSEVDSEFQEIAQNNPTCHYKLCSIVTVKMCLNAWRPFLLVTSMFLVFLSTGYPVMMAFTVTILNHLDIPYDSSQVTVLYSVCLVIGSLLTPYFMQKFKRKTVLVISALGMALSMLAMAVYEEFFYYTEVKPHAWIVPAAFCTYAVTCIIGVLPLSFMMGGELFPLEVRGILNGIYGSIGYFYWAVIFKVFPYFLMWFGIKAILWTCSFFCFLTVLLGIFVLPETKGKSLSEVQEAYFKKGKDKLQVTV